jgi:hypothetical protein
VTACGLFSVPTSVPKVDLTPPPDEPIIGGGLTPNDLNTVPPEDILNEVAYFSGAGGGGGFHCNQYTEPEMIVVAQVEYKKTFDVVMCQLPLEEVELKITQPDGAVVFEQSGVPVTDLEGTYLLFSFDISLDLPLGIYTVSASSASWNDTAVFEVVEPVEPQMYYERDPARLLLLAFRPNETVKLLVYQESELRITDSKGWNVASFVGWKEYQVDSSGRLDILIDRDSFSGELEHTPRVYYVAIGNISGNVTVSQDQNTLNAQYGTDFSDISCGEIKPLGILSGDYVEVIADQAAVISSEGDILLTLGKGETFQVTFGPRCVDGVLLWTVDCPLGIYGCLMPETNQGEAVIQKIEASEAAGSAICADAQPTQLALKIKAVVSTVADEGVNIRGEPGMDKAKVYLLKPKDTVVIVKGPACADGVLWWYVRTPKGDHEGWVREGDKKDYWLVPTQ